MVSVGCIIILLISCTNNMDESSPYGDLLSRPPYASLTDSIHKNSNNPDLYYHRGLLLKKNNNPEPALADLRKAWELSKNEEYAVAISNLLLQKHPDSAVNFIREALKNHPKSIFLKLNLARVYSDQNKLDETLNILNDIILQAPSQIDALMMKSDLLEKMDNKPESLLTLEKAYGYAPFDAELVYNLAFKYAENKDPKTIALCDSLLRMDSSGTHAEPYYFKAVYYSNTGSQSRALELLNQAIQHDYNFLDAYMDKGTILYEQKKYKDAFKVFQLASTITPTFADAYLWMGKCEEALNQKEDAKLNYQRAYGLDKTLTEAKEAAEKL